MVPRVRIPGLVLIAVSLSSSLSAQQAPDPESPVINESIDVRVMNMETVVTDAKGAYRIPQLPPGVYTLRFEREAYKPYSRDNITLRLDYSVRMNVELIPESALSEEISVVGQAPTVDIGSTSTGVNVSSSFIKTFFRA